MKKEEFLEKVSRGESITIVADLKPGRPVRNFIEDLVGVDFGKGISDWLNAVSTPLVLSRPTVKIVLQFKYGRIYSIVLGEMESRWEAYPKNLPFESLDPSIFSCHIFNSSLGEDELNALFNGNHKESKEVIKVRLHRSLDVQDGVWFSRLGGYTFNVKKFNSDLFCLESNENLYIPIKCCDIIDSPINVTNK